MRALIFTLLALAVSADHYDYGGGSYYSSWPSHGYGSSNYGSGYGSSLYGSSYGSGLGYSYGAGGSGLGYGYGAGAGQSYYSSGNIGSYSPSVYQTSRYSPGNIEAPAVAYRSGYSTLEEPAKVIYSEDLSAVPLLYSEYQQSAPVVPAAEEIKISDIPETSVMFTHGDISEYKNNAHYASPGKTAGGISFTRDFSRISEQSGIHRPDGVVSKKQTFIKTDGVGHDQRTAHHGVKSVGGTGISGIQFAEEIDGIGGQRTGSSLTGSGFSKSSTNAAAAAPKPSTGSGFSTVHTSGQRGSSGGHSQVSFSKDFSKTTGQSGLSVDEQEAHQFDRVSTVKDAVVPEKVISGSSGSSEVPRKSGVSATGGRSQVSFTRDYSKVTTGGGADVPARKTLIHRSDKLPAAVVPKPSSGYNQRTGVVAKTGNQGFSTAAGPQIFFVLGDSVLQQPASKPFGVAATKPFSVPGTTTWHKTRTQEISGLRQGDGGISWSQGVTTGSGHRGHLARRPAVASWGHLAAGGVTGSSKHDSGYAHRNVYKTHGQRFATVPGPQIHFTLGGAALQQPYNKLVSRDRFSAPAAVVARKPYSGYSRVTAALSKNTVPGSSTVTGPSRISFIQDFSRISDKPTGALRPDVSSFDKLGVPTFPGYQSQGHQSTKVRYESSVVQKPVQRPIEVKVQQQQFVQQPVFTAINDNPFLYELPRYSEGFVAGDESIFVETPASQFDGHSVDLKYNIPSVESTTRDRLSSFVLIPETVYTHDKSSESSDLKHSSGSEDTLSAGFQDTSDDNRSGGSTSFYKLSSESKSKDKPTTYAADKDDAKSAISFHASGVEPSSTSIEEKKSIDQLSPGGSSLSSKDTYVPQMPVS